MPVTTYLTACTLDGFLADEHDDLDWLLTMPGGDDDTNPYPAFLAGVGALCMGATTYQWVLGHENGPWPYEQPAWVFTHRDLEIRRGGGDIQLTSAPVEQVHAQMRRAAGDRDLWVVGGGDVAGQFLDAGLLDEIVVSFAPVTLGAGKPLLPRRHTEPFRLLSVTSSPAQTFVHARYAVR